jgi:hypothetical protein
MEEPFKRAKGHEFQEERNTFGAPGNQGAPLPRDNNRRAISIYRQGNTVPLELAADPKYRALNGQQNFFQLIPNYTVVANLFLPAADRTYLFIQNLDGVETLFVGIGTRAAVDQGVRLIPGAYFEPFRVPQNDIWIIGSGTGRCIFLYATV